MQNDPSNFQEENYALVYKRGTTSKYVKSLIVGMNQLLLPRSYPKFRFRKSNEIRDLLAVSNQLKVSFLVQFSSQGHGTFMHLIRVPSGPSLLFNVVNYTADCQTNPIQTPALTIFQGFPSTSEMQVCQEALKQLFPQIDTQKQQIFERIIVISYSQSENLIQIRHFRFHHLAGVDSGLFDALSKKRAPHQLTSQVLSFQELSDKLTELGPKIDIKLIKIVEGIQKGAVLFHLFKNKPDSGLNEVELKKKAKQTERRVMKQQLSKIRRKQQVLLQKQQEIEKQKEEEKRKQEALNIKLNMMSDQGDDKNDQGNENQQSGAHRSKKRTTHSMRNLKKRQKHQ